MKIWSEHPYQNENAAEASITRLDFFLVGLEIGAERVDSFVPPSNPFAPPKSERISHDRSPLELAGASQEQR